MKYSELINRKKEYKYSANICFDIANEERLAGFIPNRTTTEILSEYIYGIADNTNVHSRILYGSYGTGKSHLLTVLSALLGRVNTEKKGYNTFIESIKRYDPELAVYLTEFKNSGKQYLVVPVYSDFKDFDKCITFSLKKELENKGINIVFQSYYQEAKELLKTWESQEESANRLSDILKETGIDLDALYAGLERFEDGCEKQFNVIFKKMTYGANFVSETGNLIDNLNAANAAIKGEYEGIVFIFDEFGRYIEDEGENVRVKSIQDMAEYCDHSGYNDYLILVSHKQLSLYTDRMQKDLSNEWKKVEGRFKATSINIKYDQCLSLISHIIPKTSAWNSYYDNYKDELTELFNKAYDFKGFMLPSDGERPFEGGFPLHPITLFSLDRLSKRVAQNERTFFTFLSSEEEYGLFSVLSKMDTDEFHFVGLDALFNYFEQNIRAFRSDEVYEIYKKYQYAINKLGATEENTVEVKVLKTMAVIYIIGDFSVLNTDRSILQYVIDESEDKIFAAIDKLEKLRIIKYMRQFGYFDFLDSSIFDFESMIEDKMGSVSSEMVISSLNEEFINFVIYPYEYNADYHMSRLFIPVFTNRQDLFKRNFVKILPEYYDGAIGMILDEDYSEEEYVGSNNWPSRMILLINKQPQELIQEVKRFIAIKYFYSKRKELSKDDPTAERELTLYLEEQKGIVRELVKNWRLFNNANIVVGANREIIDITTEKELSGLASMIMYNAFPDTIIVNNDLINKNNISGTINSSRSKVISNIINATDDIREGFTTMSPEHTIIRSVLLRNGFNPELEDCPQNILPQGAHQGRCAGKYVKDRIDKFLRQCEKAQRPISELYEVLKAEPFGLRDGYIAILLAYELRAYENVGLYFHGTEKDFDSEDFVKALKDLEGYSLYLCNWSDEQREYISALENIYSSYLKAHGKNRLKDLYNAMNTHYASIAKIARSTDKFLSPKAAKYRTIMSITHKDYHKFFFEELKAIDDDLETLKYSLPQIKTDLENVVAEIESILVKRTLSILEIDNGLGIATNLKNRFENSWKEKSEKAFDIQTTKFLEFAQNIDTKLTDEECIRELGKLITEFEIDYWNDSSVDEYEDVLKQMINRLDNYEFTEELGDNELQIVVKKGGNEEYVSRFDNREMSVNGQVMFNKMKNTLEGLGKGISHEEKMVIMAKLLSEIS